MVEDSLQEKLGAMKRILRSLERVAVAFSGGVDSTFLLKVAVDTLGPENVVAVTADSEILARAEFGEAVKLAESCGAEHVVLKTCETDNPDYRANPTDRCYHCRLELFSR